MDTRNNKVPEYKLILEPLTEEAKKKRCFSQWSPKELGQRFKIGGDPKFIQNEEWPICNECARKMVFYAQLDAVGNEYDLADMGLIYVFVCFDCFTTRSILQSF